MQPALQTHPVYLPLYEEYLSLVTALVQPNSTSQNEDRPKVETLPSQGFFIRRSNPPSSKAFHATRGLMGTTSNP